MTPPARRGEAGPGPRAGMPGAWPRCATSGRPESDDFLALQPLEGGGVELQPLLVDLGVVRAQQRGGLHRRGGFGELHGLAGIVNEPQPGCSMVVTMPRAIRCGSDRNLLRQRARRRWGTPALPSAAMTSCFVRVIVQAFDERVHLVLVGGAPLRIRPLGVADQVGPADGLEARRPTCAAARAGSRCRRSRRGRPGLHL